MDVATEVIDVDECMRLLATQSVGRLAVVAGRYPRIIPVNFALDQGIVVFRTGPGTKLDAAQHRNVAFEVDEVDLAGRSGWSVLVTGMAEVVTDRHSDEVVERSQGLAIDPFESGEKRHWVRILPDEVTGRRITPDELLDPTDARGYL